MGKHHGIGTARPIIFMTRIAQKMTWPWPARRMYRHTGNEKYLDDAEKNANQIGSQYSFDYGDLNSMACYQIAQLDPKFKTNTIGAARSTICNLSPRRRIRQPMRRS